MKVKSLSCVGLFATLWSVAHQAPLSMEFPRQEYWSGLPCPSPGDFPNPGIKPGSPALQADSLASESPGEVWLIYNVVLVSVVQRSDSVYMYVGFPGGSVVKGICLPMQKMQETPVRSLGQKDPLEEDMATHSSILAWGIPWTKEPGGPQSMGSQRVRYS